MMKMSKQRRAAAVEVLRIALYQMNATDIAGASGVCSVLTFTVMVRACKWQAVRDAKRLLAQQLGYRTWDSAICRDAYSTRLAYFKDLKHPITKRGRQQRRGLLRRTIAANT